MPGAIAQGTTTPAPGTWAHDPSPDRFDPQALLDLRSLNEAEAGETGFVTVDGQGGFRRGDGKPLRFWAVNSGVGFGWQATPRGPQTAPDLARHARFLAKRGVNMVRLHRQLSPPPQAGQSMDRLNEAERDGVWRAVAAYRREGIYVTLSPYWAGPMRFAPDTPLAGGPQPAWGLLFFDETLQRSYRSWLTQLLRPKNPHTGLALVDDPALAILQLQNEDSLLFWTLEGLKGPQREALERRYGRWLAGRHGSVDQALAAWAGGWSLGGGPSEPADRSAEGRLALLPLWTLAQPPRSAAMGRRLADQTEFLATTMRDFNQRTVDWLRRDLGVKALVNAGNWRTADEARLGDAERWSYGPGEVDAANVYTHGLHEGEHVGWAVLAGDRYTDGSVLRDPRRLPLALRQVAGRPMLVTEAGWVMPGGYGAEGPFLVAAFQSLLGTAGYYWFATGEEGHVPPRSANGWLDSQSKWTFGMPEVIGGFPAAALLYRRGDVQRAPPTVVQRRPLASLWQREPAQPPEDPAYDPNRDAQAAQRPDQANDAFLLGPVLVAFGDAPAPRAAPPAPSADGVLRPATGELAWDRRQGVLRLESPRAQGVAAHFDTAPRHTLRDLRLTCGNRFGALLAVSLDDQPLARSRRVLVQFCTPSRPTGWAQVPASLKRPDGRGLDGFRITSHGRAPWQVERAALQLWLRNAALVRATALDANFMAAGTVTLRAEDGGVSFDFPASGTQHVLLQA
jgi:hypothetical protein